MTIIRLRISYIKLQDRKQKLYTEIPPLWRGFFVFQIKHLYIWDFCS